MGLIYIALSVVCSLTIAHFIKLSNKGSARLINVLVINYLVAFLISLTISRNEFTQCVFSEPMLLIFTIVLGTIFIANLFIYSESLNRIGMGISISAMRMSLVIPIGVSLFVYGETIHQFKYVGIVLVFVALYLMVPKTNSTRLKDIRDSIYPILLFLMTGIADASLKVFQREYSTHIPEYGFLGLIFFSSFIIGSVYLFTKKELNFSKKEIFYGIIIGVANLYSSFFLLLALQETEGSIVFSLTNVSNVVLGSIIGFLVWKDELSTLQKLGILLATISILLLI
tara:strand:+ start:6306 stop:7157 length:852 start_codon:yes stop_codon:yes gene_type:complete